MKLRAGLFLLLLLLLSLAGCASHATKEAGAETPAQILAQANTAWVQGDFTTAATGYSELLKQSPTNPAALRGLGEASLSLGQAQDALAAFDEALNVNAKDIDALEGRGLAMIGLNRPDKAELDLRRVLAVAPQRWRALSGMGLVADLKGDAAAAMSWYESALSYCSDEPSIYNNYGYSRLMAHAYPQAEALFRRGLSVKGDLPRLHNNLLLAIAWQGDYARALAARGAIPLPVALNNVGYVALLRNDVAAAAKLFQQALDASSSWYPQAAANLALAQKGSR